MDLKINQLEAAKLDAVKKNTTQSTDSDFKFKLVSKVEEEELQGKLNSLLEDINVQGEKLAKHMDIRDMKRYRELVKNFMNEVVTRSHKFSRENFLDKRGRHRVYGLVKVVDKNLDELATELVADEKDQIAILGKIDEIKGLLLDIKA